LTQGFNLKISEKRGKKIKIPKITAPRHIIKTAPADISLIAFIFG